MQQSVDEMCAQSLAMCAFPSPPLPQVVFREAAAERDVASSHDLVATGMRAAQAAKSEWERRAQMQAQLALLDVYNRDLDALFFEHEGGGVHVLPRVYAAMQRYTRGTVALYADQRDPDVVFAPADAADERLRAAAARHLVLYRQIAGGPALVLADVQHLRYEELLMRFFELYCEDGVREREQSRREKRKHEQSEQSTALCREPSLLGECDL